MLCLERDGGEQSLGTTPDGTYLMHEKPFRDLGVDCIRVGALNALLTCSTDSSSW